jgi:hypothetical protein
LVSFDILHSLNSTAVNGDVFIKNLQGGTFAFEHSQKTIKSIKFGLKIILIHLTSIINLIIPFHSVFVTIQQSERNFFSKGTTFVYVNSTAVNGDVFIKNLQGGTFAFEHSQKLDSHIPYEDFCG